MKTGAEKTERKPWMTRGVAVLIAILLIVAGVLTVVGASSIRFTHRETETSCYELQGGDFDIDTNLDALVSARLTDFPLGIACEWDAADGTTFVQYSWFEQESVFVLLGVGGIVFALVLLVRSRRFPTAIAD